MLTKKEISRKIRGISSRNAKLRDDIHEVLCHSAGHVVEHGDVTNIAELFNAVTGQDMVALVKWSQDRAFIRVDPKTGTVRLNKAARNAYDGTGDELVSELLDGPKWYETACTVEKAARALDVAARLESLAKSISQKAANGEQVKADMQAIESAYRNVLRAVKGEAA